MKDVTSFVSWDELKGKEARGMQDDADLGEVQQVGRHYIVTQKGLVSKDKFYLPKYLAEGYDGHTLYFKVTETQKDGFKREIPPTYEEYSVYRVADTPAEIENRVVLVEKRRVTDPDRRRPAVINWGSTVHKNVRAADGEPVGNIVAVFPDSIHVETAGSRSQYVIPKEEVEGLNGSEVTLKASIEDLGQFVRPGP